MRVTDQFYAGAIRITIQTTYLLNEVSERYEDMPRYNKSCIMFTNLIQTYTSSRRVTIPTNGI